MQSSGPCSFNNLSPTALRIVPLGVKALLAADLKITNCIELDWWQSHHYLSTTGETIEVIFTPTKHWTARGFTDRNTCLWGSFAVLSSQSKVSEYVRSASSFYIFVTLTLRDLFYCCAIVLFHRRHCVLLGLQANRIDVRTFRPRCDPPGSLCPSLVHEG